MAALNAVDSTGVDQELIEHMNDWHRWIYYGDDARSEFDLLWDQQQEESWLHRRMLTQRDAEYIVACLRVFLPLESVGKKPQKTSLSLGSENISDEAIAVFSNFLQQPDAALVALRLDHRPLPLHQYSQLLISLHTNTSVKELRFTYYYRDHEEERARLMVDLLQHRTEIKACLHFYVYFTDNILRIFGALPHGLPNLRKLEILGFSRTSGGNRFRSILQAIRDGDFPMLDDLDFTSYNITSVGLCYLFTELGLAARRRLRKLSLNHNSRLLDDLESTRLFVQNFLLSDDMNLNELGISTCGNHVQAIIEACENDKNKLQKLEIHDLCTADFQTVRRQLIESMPKMKRLKHLVCDSFLFDLDNRPAMLQALRKNTSIVELTLLDEDWDDGDNNDYYDETRLLIAPTMKRNQILQHADALLALQPTTGMPIRSKSGLWCKAFAKMAPPAVSNDDNDAVVNGGFIGASAIFKILQQRPGFLEKQLGPKNYLKTAEGRKRQRLL